MSEAGFAWPELLWLLGLVPLHWLLARFCQRRRERELRRWKLPPHVVGPARVGRLPLLVLACGVLAAAGPYWGQQLGRSQAEGQDLLILLDVSRSMLAEDQPPSSRLLRAQQQILKLLDGLEKGGRADRVAVVAFAGSARLLSPFTRDYDHVRAAVRNAGPALFAAAERVECPAEEALPRTLARAAEWLPVSGVPRVALLISDGDGIEADGEAIHKPLRSLASSLHVYAVGDPDRQWRIPTGDREVPFLLRESEAGQELVLSQRRDAVLAAVAALGRGELIPEEDSGLNEWWADAAARLPRPFTTETGLRQRVPRYGWLTAAAILLLAWRFLPAIQPRAWGVMGLLAFSALGLGLASSSKDGQALWLGQTAFLRGDYAAALAHYSAALPSTTDPGRVSFNQAACLSRLGRWEEAAEAYRRALEDAEGQRAVLAWLGRGGALAHLGAATAGPAAVPVLRHALRCFDEAASLLPSLADSAETKKIHDDLAHNRAEVERLLTRKSQEAPPPGAEPPPAAPQTESEGPPGAGASEEIRRGGGQLGSGEPSQPGTAGDRETPGAGNLPLALIGARPMNAKDAERLLEATLQRLEQVQRLRGQGPAVLRAGERDW